MTLTTVPVAVARNSPSYAARDHSRPDEPETRTYSNPSRGRQDAEPLPRLMFPTSAKENQRSRPTQGKGTFPSTAHRRSVIGWIPRRSAALDMRNNSTL
jgi:hypothetical protein